MEGQNKLMPNIYIYIYIYIYTYMYMRILPHYHQLLGTAIGTKFAPNYADLFMAGIEDKTFQQSLTKP